jgi:hypothetical protein
MPVMYAIPFVPVPGVGFGAEHRQRVRVDGVERIVGERRAILPHAVDRIAHDVLSAVAAATAELSPSRDADAVQREVALQTPRVGLRGRVVV